MSSSKSAPQASNLCAAGETSDIQIDLRLSPCDAYSCPLTALLSPDDPAFPDCARRVDPVQIAFTKNDGRCLVKLVLEDGTVVSKAGTSSASCLCDRFQQYGCVPQFTELGDGQLHVTTHLCDRTQIRPLIGDLKAVSETVNVDRLFTVDSTGDDDVVLFDRSVLTEKQREAIELAIERGYYSGDTQLAELADELGIGRSALSERIRTAHTKLVTEMF